MDIIFDKGTNREEFIPESEILKMSKQDIKNLKARCQATMNEIALKRNNFRCENTFGQNSPEYWKKMNAYKGAIARFTKIISWLGQIEPKNEPTTERDHWLWTYYQESLKMLTEDMVNQIIEMTDERCGYHVTVERIQENNYG